MSSRIGILGGTFNPIHYGHLAAAEEIRDRLKLDRMLFIPSAIPPHKPGEDVPPAEHRMEMVRLALAGNPYFEASDLEIRRGGRSYTVDTVEMLLQTHPGAVFFFITGVDAFLEIQTWDRWDRLVSLCSFVVISRPGYSFRDLAKIDFMKSAVPELSGLDRGARSRWVVESGGITVWLETVPLFDISSTDIRKRTREGRSIKYHLPEAVETYIMKHKFYA